MENIEITEDRLTASGWRKVGNTFYKDRRAITHFEGKFQIWVDGQHHHIKTMQEIRYFAEELQGIKKPGL